MEQVNIYIATAVKNKVGAFTYILEVERNGKDVTLTKTEKEEKEVTGNQIAVIALGKALERMSKKCNLTIYTDSVQIKNTLKNGWIEKWKENQWKNSKGQPIAYQEEWMKVAELLNSHNVQVSTDSHSYKSWMESTTRREIKNEI